METNTYTVLSGGESIYEVASKLGYPFEELMEHNDIQTPDALPEGYELHLPYARVIPEYKPIRYEILDKPRLMHVIEPDGIKKFSFAGIEKWEDLTVSGPTYPFNANVEVVAIAHVPIGLDSAAYYMDALALGNDFEATGRPTYTVGFNHSQLADGYIEPEKKPIPPEREQRLKVLIQGDQDQPAPEIATMPTTEIDYQIVENIEEWHKWLSTYVGFPDGPVLYVAEEEMWVKDFMERRDDKLLKASQDVVVAGTFVKDDIEYGRPLGAVKNFLWYGIPMTNLISAEELYNTDIPLLDRVAIHGRLSASERYITVPLAKAISQTIRLKVYLSKIKIKKTKE